MSQANLKNTDKESLKVTRLEVRGKTLIFDNSVYQIANISAFEVGKLSVPFPWKMLWIPAILTAIAFWFIEEDSFTFFVFFGSSLGIFLSWLGASTKYGLIIRLNSGFTP